MYKEFFPQGISNYWCCLQPCYVGLGISSKVICDHKDIYIFILLWSFYSWKINMYQFQGSGNIYNVQLCPLWNSLELQASWTSFDIVFNVIFHPWPVEPILQQTCCTFYTQMTHFIMASL